MDKNLKKKIKQIDIQLRRRSHSVFSGVYRSVVKGHGLTFSHVREYVPGDDVRSMAWSLTAKMSKPYLKVFEEEKQSQIILAIDVSSSMNFGTSSMSKKSAVEHLSSLLAFCAVNNKDSLGLLLFSSDVELYLPPKKSSSRHSFRVIKEICGFKSQSKQTDIEKALVFLNKVLKRRTHIFLFSDFLAPQAFERALKQLKKRHEVLNVFITDPFEESLPHLGLVDIEDLETGQKNTLDFSFLNQKVAKTLKENKIYKQQLGKSQFDNVFINCNEDIYQVLIDFFKKRKKAV